MHVTATIIAAFADTRRPIDAATAHRIAGLLGSATIDDAIRQACNDGARTALQELLAYKEALHERREPSRLIRRLLVEADDLERRCEAVDSAAAESFGKAAYRRSRGDLELAGQLAFQAAAAEATAAGLRDQALARRLDAAITAERQETAHQLSRVAVSG